MVQRLHVLLLFLLLASQAPSISWGQAGKVDWETIQHEVLLGLQKRDVGKWAQELAAKASAKDQPALIKAFFASTWAGHDDSVKKLIDQLATVQQRADENMLRLMLNELHKRPASGLQVYFVERIERLPRQRAYVLARHWAATKTFAETDRLLAERDADANWFEQRLRFRRHTNTAIKYLEELAANVRAKPTRLKAVNRYLTAVARVGLGRKANLSWLTKVCKPATAYDQLRLGHSLRSRPSIAVVFIERSLATPYTAADQKAMENYFTRSSRARPKRKSWESALRGWAKKTLMDHYKKLGQANKAQTLLEQLTADEKDGLHWMKIARTAGQIQGTSGARVVEKRILKKEKDNKHNSAYWIARGQYYDGRKEYPRAAKAYQKALATAKDIDERNAALRYYGHLLERRQGKQARVDLFWKAYQNPINARYRLVLARELGTAFYSDHREEFWRLIASAKEWSGNAEINLETAQYQAKKIGQAELDRFLARAEKLAQPPHSPDRAYVFGSMLSVRQPKRAIPFLKRAAKDMPAENYRSLANHALIAAQMRAKDWKGAEQTWRKAFPTGKELVAAIAWRAAEQGDKANAMRLWKIHVNFDRDQTRYVSNMMRAGMKKELVAFYQDLQRRDPTSKAPARILAYMATVRVR